MEVGSPHGYEGPPVNLAIPMDLSASGIMCAHRTLYDNGERVKCLKVSGPESAVLARGCMEAHAAYILAIPIETCSKITGDGWLMVGEPLDAP